MGLSQCYRRSILDRWLDEQILSDDSGFGHLRNGGDSG